MKPTLPYVRLYRREEGSFAQLALMTRALAGMLLKLADDDGVIHLGHKAPHEAVCFGLGAERTERKSVRAHVQVLLDDGYLVHDPATRTMRIPSFPRFAETPKTEPQRSVVAAPSEPERRSDDAVSEPQRSDVGASTELQHEAKCAESHGAPLTELRDQLTQESKEKTPPPPVREVFDVFEYHPAHPVVAAVVEAWQAEYQQAWVKPYVVRGHADRVGAAKLAHWCERFGQAGGDPAEVGARITRNFLVAKKHGGGRPPVMAWLDPDGTSYPLNPAAYLEAPAPRAVRPVRPVARGPHPGSPSSVHAAEATPLPAGEPFAFDVQVAEIR